MRNENWNRPTKSNQHYCDSKNALVKTQMANTYKYLCCDMQVKRKCKQNHLYSLTVKQTRHTGISPVSD